MTNKQFLLSIDPGKSSGAVLGTYSDTEPYTRLEAWQFGGGVEGFLEWWVGAVDGRLRVLGLTIISERFVPLQGAGFSLTSDSVEPLRVEGAMQALGVMPYDYDNKRWQRAACQLLAGGSTKVERKKNSGLVLKQGGLWLTGKDVGQKDADDAISAQKHALWYLLHTVKHEPTIRRFWPDASNN